MGTKPMTGQRIDQVGKGHEEHWGWDVMEGLKDLGKASHKLIFTSFFPPNKYYIEV